MSTRHRVRFVTALCALVLAGCSAEHDAPPFTPDTPLGALTLDERAELCHWLRARTALDGKFVEATCAYEALQGGSEVHGCDERRALCMFTRARSSESPGCFAELPELTSGCAGTRVAEHSDCVHELRRRVLPFEGAQCADDSPSAAAGPAPACVALLDACPSALLEWGID